MDILYVNLFKYNSTIEEVTVENDTNMEQFFEDIFAALKTFENLKCIYMRYHNYSYNDVTSAFKKPFTGRDVELSFYIEPCYF